LLLQQQSVSFLRINIHDGHVFCWQIQNISLAAQALRLMIELDKYETPGKKM